jgi:hypothetical protein
MIQRSGRRSFFVANGRSQYSTGALSRLHLYPNTYLNKHPSATELFRVGLLAAA